MKAGIVVLAIVFVASLSSCTVTQKQKPVDYGGVVTTQSPISYQNEEVDSVLSFPGTGRVNMVLTNKTDEVIPLVVDLSSFTTKDGISTKLVTGETIKMDTNKPQPAIPIPPKSNFNKDFYFANDRSWSPNNLHGSTFVFCYRFDDKEKYIVFSGCVFR